LFIGDFNLDLSDGDLCFKASLSFDSVMLASALICEVVTPNVLIMDKYLTGIQSVSGGEQTS